MLHAVIIAGGSGKRLWPKSRTNSPKFLLKIKGKKTLLEETIDRAKQLIPLKNILVLTNKGHVSLIRKNLPKLPKANIIAEPVSRNTGPAVLLAASLVNKKDPNGVIFVMPADQVIEDRAALKEMFSLASLIAHIKKSIITIGIKPTFPATGYGYIKTGKFYKQLAVNKRYDAYKVDRFVEKPSHNKAKNFLKTKKYLWNGGIFIGKARTFLDEFKKYKPALCKTARKIEKSLGGKKQNNAIKRHYKNFQNISIDYAIMQKTKLAYVIKADIKWQDIGSWKSFDKYIGKDSKANAVIGSYLGIDTKNSVIIGDKKHLIATVGIDNLVIIHTKDATLVVAKDRAEDVKKIVELLEKKGLKGYL